MVLQCSFRAIFPITPPRPNCLIYNRNKQIACRASHFRHQKSNVNYFGPTSVSAGRPPRLLRSLTLRHGALPVAARHSSMEIVSASYRISSS